MDIFEKNEFTLTGKGKIIFDSYETDIDFTIEYYPFNIILKTSKIILIEQNFGKFIGNESLNNTLITCEDICLQRITENELIFLFTEDLKIGNEIDCKIFSAKIFGINQNIKEFKINNFLVRIKPIKNFDNLNLFNDKFANNYESSELIIEDVNSNILDKDLTREVCNDICLILSFIFAKKITYNRFDFLNSTNKCNF